MDKVSMQVIVMKRILFILAAAMGMLLFSGCGGQKSEAVGSSGTASGRAAAMPKNAAVVYFSATGNTKAVAEHMSAMANMPIYEIVPQEPYTKEDLDYNVKDCRANKEQQDDRARPAIKGDLGEVKKYETIYLGYPIWWDTAPRIIETFLEQYDLRGKRVYVFCTSGGSGIKGSVEDLNRFMSGLHISGGKEFSPRSSDTEIMEWLGSTQK